ncbi:MAG TPA: alpha/beta hydrolase [Mycobacteriales bacterium]|jgi:acetyl esterase|nr:alpha/beta hydrolase [Mycobacteriales bacterium]
MSADRAGEFADQELADYVAGIRAEPGPSARALGAAGLRQGSQRRRASRPRGPDLDSVADLVLEATPALHARLYIASRDPRPLLVFFHGGGWVLGDLDSHDRTCRRLASLSDVALLAVDYRRAPEDPWPAALDDAAYAVNWARDRVTDLGGGDQVAVIGDSAGGAIATLCCLRLRDLGEPQPAVQVLAYPNTDLTCSRPSMIEKASGWGLDADDVRWFAEQWVPDASTRADPRVSPLLEPDLAGLAPAVVVTAEHDPLRDEGDAYADALRDAGVDVVHRQEAGLVHGFLSLDLVSPAAAAAAARLAQDIRAHFTT